MPTRTRKTQPAAPPEGERTSEARGKTSKVGNLCGDPELRFAQSGEAYASARIAVEEPVTPGDWSGERRTTFYDLTVFGGMAEHFAMSCARGVRVVVMGRAFLETWPDGEGGRAEGRKILADAIGPDLRWATATVTKVVNGNRAPAGNRPDHSDEEPF